MIINQISQISEIQRHKIFQQSVKDKYLFKLFLKSKILQLFQMSEAQKHKVFPKGGRQKQCSTAIISDEIRGTDVSR